MIADGSAAALVAHGGVGGLVVELAVVVAVAALAVAAWLGARDGSD